MKTTLALVLGLFCALAVAQKPFKCVRPGLHADTETCFKFFRCAEDLSIVEEGRCDEGQSFHAVQKACVLHKKAVCSYQLPETYLEEQRENLELDESLKELKEVEESLAPVKETEEEPVQASPGLVSDNDIKKIVDEAAEPSKEVRPLVRKESVVETLIPEDLKQLIAHVDGVIDKEIKHVSPKEKKAYLNRHYQTRKSDNLLEFIESVRDKVAEKISSKIHSTLKFVAPEASKAIIFTPNGFGADSKLQPSNQGKARPRGYIYMTFDDGPNQGTREVARILKQEGIHATFFINGEYLENEYWQRPRTAFVEVVTGGNLIGDHSYGHLRREDGSYSYRSVADDANLFGPKNVGPVLALMREYRFPTPLMDRVRTSMSTYVRMPFCNTWRLASGVRATDPACPTTHPLSTRVADKLHDERNKQVFGWDVEWVVDFESGSPVTTGEYMVKGVTHLTDEPKSNGKVVILTHDAGFRSKHGQKQLRHFIRKAKQAGYVFRKLDSYFTD